MTKLQCSVSSCANHKGDCCCRPDIRVGGSDACSCEETCCDSFRTKEEAANSVVRHDVPDENVDILCTAHNCSYNEDGCCHADHVSVGGYQACNCGETECDTFRCR